MKSMFPIPRITEAFFEDVGSSLGWKRYTDIKKPADGRANADFIWENFIIELKIIEEEGLEKKERQDKIARLYKESQMVKGEVELEPKSVPKSIRYELEKILGEPIKGAVKKAAKQIKDTREDLNLYSSKGVLLIANNGYSSLDPNNFENLVKKITQNTSKQIDFVFCTTVQYHHGPFDFYIFCTSNCHSIFETKKWEHEEEIISKIENKFNDCMTQVIRDQNNPKFWKENLTPVSDILFERDGVRYIRRAPEVPDSRFKKNE